MSTGLNQYAVYRLRRDIKETRSLRNQSYQYLLKNNRKVASDHYRQLFLARFDPALTPADLRRQLEKELPAGMWIHSASFPCPASSMYMYLLRSSLLGRPTTRLKEDPERGRSGRNTGWTGVDSC